MRLLNQLRTSIRARREWIARWQSLPVSAWISAAEHYQRGEFAKAAALYERGLSTHPNSPAKVNALLDLGHCLFRLSRFAEAEQYLRQATTDAPHEREAYVRLARLQLWLGYSHEALWTMRVCLQRMSPDPELATLFITAVVESGGSFSGISEAKEILQGLHYDAEGFPRLEVARARLSLITNDSESARDDLAKIASMDGGPFEAVVAFAEILLKEGKIAYARHHLHRSLTVAPEHPRVLRLLAATYLREGTYFEPEYAVQIAQKACQVTAWRGVHEMYTLAQAFITVGEQGAALLVACKAKDLVAKLLGSYPEVVELERKLQSAPIDSPAQ